MTEKHIQLAVVVDEYGGTAGIVTIEDIIEFIFGNIQDEFDNEEEEVSKINDSTFTIDGITDIEEVSEILHKKLPLGDYDTLGGFIISLLGYLPEDGEKVVQKFENVTFTVLNVEDKRIGKVRVEIDRNADSGEEESEKE